MERIAYPLRHPIQRQELDDSQTVRLVEIKVLSLAPRVKGVHMRATDGARGPVEAKLLLISALAGITRAEADELDEVDIIAIDNLYGDEPPPLDAGAGKPADGPTTGGTSSET